MSMGDMAKKLGEMWKEMSAEEKAKYEVSDAFKLMTLLHIPHKARGSKLTCRSCPDVGM